MPPSLFLLYKKNPLTVEATVRGQEVVSINIQAYSPFLEAL
jgi:hypothetical protein